MGIPSADSRVILVQMRKILYNITVAFENV